MTKKNAIDKFRDEANLNLDAARKLIAQVGDKTPSIEEDVRIREHALTALEDRQIAKLFRPKKAKRSGITVREPDTYSRTSRNSWFADLAAASLPTPPPGVDPAAARERLARNAQREESARIRRNLLRSSETRNSGVLLPDHGGALASRGGDLQRRDLSLAALGSGGVWSPPLWLLKDFGDVARAAAPLMRMVTAVPLPDGVSSVSIPRIIASGGVVPVLENLDDQVFWTETDLITSEISTGAAVVPMSTQLHDRTPNMDAWLTQSFASSWAETSEQQLIAGTGTNGQQLGWLSLPTTNLNGSPGAGSVSYTTATPTNVGIVGAIAQAAALVGNIRKRPPNLAVCTPERYFALAGTPDGSGFEPTVRPGTGTAGGDAGSWGPLAGLNTYLDGTVPQDLGTTGDEDAIVVARGRDTLFMQSDPHFLVYTDTQVGASQLTVFAQYHVYFAMIVQLPQSVAVVTGTGLSRGKIAW